MLDLGYIILRAGIMVPCPPLRPFEPSRMCNDYKGSGSKKDYAKDALHARLSINSVLGRDGAMTGVIDSLFV